MMKINKLMTLQLIAAMAVSVSLTSCSNNSTVGNSSATGWKINGKKDGFQYNKNYNGQQTPYGMVEIEGGTFKGKKITFHDPCYLGRANGEYEAPRMLLEKLDAELVEMKRCKTNGLCCGAGGAQMFKEPEKGNKDINIERTEEALAESPKIIATGCPFCNTMMTDGVKHFNKNEEVEVKDIAELLAEAEDL